MNRAIEPRARLAEKLISFNLPSRISLNVGVITFIPNVGRDADLKYSLEARFTNELSDEPSLRCCNRFAISSPQ